MKQSLYPKIAADGIRKNGRLYIPYFLTSILMVALFYIMHLLGFSDMVGNFMGATTAKDIMKLGTVIMAVFGTVFLFYTQSALVKGRLKEFGLYSVLGMNRKNLGKILFFESLISWLIAIAGGITAGIGLSKLAELGFAKIIMTEVNYRFNLSASSVFTTIVVYSFIFFLIHLNAIRQIRFSRTINLIKSDKIGEKPPKANWFVGMLGLVILLAGYIMALRIKQPLSALVAFFLAVILVIIGTYLVLIAGSVLLCRILQKNKRYYYKTNHFVSVSSMAYRMKRNGASLASICILLTMVLVMVSSTSALYFNREETLANHYPRAVDCHVSMFGEEEGSREYARKLEESVNAKVKASGAEIRNELVIYDYSFAGYYKDGYIDIDTDPMTLGAVNYDNVANVYFFDLEDYNRLTGSNESLSSGEALIGDDGTLAAGGTLKVGDVEFSVVKKFDIKKSDLKHAVISEIVKTVFIVVDDVDKVAAHYKEKKDFTGSSILEWSWNYYFDTNLDENSQIELSKEVGTHIRDVAGRGHCENRDVERSDFIKSFGGLFFLGILLSIIFLVSCVLIIYYKQISEGFEDQSRFGIMQKVGMTKENIKKSINSQMFTVFLIPILFACLHLAAVLPIVHKLLLLFGHNNLLLLLGTAGICVLVCGMFYALVYKLTSNAYYKIVS